eukprot:3710424-Ditylum_brightwellii.AAC.1
MHSNNLSLPACPPEEVAATGINTDTHSCKTPSTKANPPHYYAKLQPTSYQQRHHKQTQCQLLASNTANHVDTTADPNDCQIISGHKSPYTDTQHTELLPTTTRNMDYL